MTVEAIARKAGPYQYTAGASYPFYYKVFSAEDVAVYVVQDSSEVQLTEDQYTVNLNDDQDNNPGGTVSVSVTCESITIVSDVDYTQETVITNRGGFYPDVLNKIHDKLTILIQQILTTLNRTVKIKVTDATSDPDKILDDLKTTASAAAESAAISVSAAQASADSAATAIATANTAVSKSETAITTADTANATATQALSSIPSTVAETVNTTISGMDIPQLVSDDVDNKIDSLNLDEKIASEVKDAIAGTEIPGLTPETIAGALGYVPYDAETNSQDFATTTEVTGQITEATNALQEAIDAIPGQVNADWNATSGVAEILNKPTAMTGATAETAGKQGFVPVPEAGDQNKVLKGDGTWGTIASRNIGETVFSLLPLSDAGLHLLDGSLLQVGGIYDAFIAHMAGLQTDYPGLFVTESEWQESVESYGVCGKFVYTEGVSLRIPKITGFVEGTLDAAALGDLVEAGLPNIKGGVTNQDSGVFGAGTGALYVAATAPNKQQSTAGTAGSTVGFDASRSNPIYGRSATVQPQSIKGYLYMVVATSAKTDIEVDIDQIATDLNGKAGVDLANVNAAGKAVIANLGMPSSMAVSLTYTEGGQFTVPADGYLVLRASTSQGGIYIVNISNGIIVSSISEREWALGCVLQVKKGDIVQVISWQASSHSLFFLYAEGSQP